MVAGKRTIIYWVDFHGETCTKNSAAMYNGAAREVMLICKSVAFRRSRAGTGPFRVTFEVEIRELGEDSQQVFAGIQVVGLAGFHEGRQMLFCNWNIMRLCHFTNVLYG